MKATSCDYCANYVYDEESESYYCDVNLDEDEYYRFISTEYKECPYYRNGDEYRVVRHLCKFFNSFQFHLAYDLSQLFFE